MLMSCKLEKNIYMLRTFGEKQYMTKILKCYDVYMLPLFKALNFSGFNNDIKMLISVKN